MSLWAAVSGNSLRSRRNRRKPSFSRLTNGSYGRVLYPAFNCNRIKALAYSGDFPDKAHLVLRCKLPGYHRGRWKQARTSKPEYVQKSAVFELSYNIRPDITRLEPLFQGSAHGTIAYAILAMAMNGVGNRKAKRTMTRRANTDPSPAGNGKPVHGEPSLRTRQSHVSFFNPPANGEANRPAARTGWENERRSIAQFS